MNKKEFKELDREQMIIAFNQLKDDYSSLFNQLEKEKEKNKELNEALERSSGRVTELTVENSDLKYQIYHKQQIIDELTQNEEKLKIELRKEKERNELFVASGNSINLERHIKNNYISKDKIKEKIEELEKRYTEHCYFQYDKKEVLDICINELKELLKESE